MAAAFLSPLSTLIYVVVSTSLVFLTVLGALAAHAGGAPLVKGALRVLVGGALAMVVTAGIGALVGAPA